MPHWLKYHTVHLPSSRSDVVYCGRTKRNQVIYVARTFHEGSFVPGYAVDDIGYFISKERKQPFQTRNYEVLAAPNIDFAEYTSYHEKGLVADDSVEESKRTKIGSFEIEGVRFCGLVDNKKTCYINFEDKVKLKEAPEFHVLIDLATC